MGEQRIDEARRTRFGHRRVGISLLGGEGIALQPVEQGAAVARDHIELRAVHMGVDEAGQDQPAAVVDALPARVGLAVHRARRLRIDDAAVLDQQPVVGPPAHTGRVGGRCEAGVGGEIEQVSPQRDTRCHAPA